MGKIISIDEINRAATEGKDDLVFELCKVFDHESYFDPIFDPPESFLQECEAYWSRRSPFCKTVERKIGNTLYTIETVCDGAEPLTAKVKRLIFLTGRWLVNDSDTKLWYYKYKHTDSVG